MSQERFAWGYGGRRIQLYDIKPEDVAPRRVAPVLAKLCRWNGQTRDFWSIAQHLCFCSYIPTVPVEKLAALLHDVHEAVTSDVIKPVLLELEEQGEKFLHELAQRIDVVVETAYGVKLCPHPESVKYADRVSAVFEAIYQMEVPSKETFRIYGQDFVIANRGACAGIPGELRNPLSIKRAERLWLARLAELQFEVRNWLHPLNEVGPLGNGTTGSLGKYPR
jgi:hypothetical protein